MTRVTLIAAHRRPWAPDDASIVEIDLRLGRRKRLILDSDSVQPAS
jgi:hypothetical protein